MPLFKHNVNGQQSATVVQLLQKIAEFLETTRQKTKTDNEKQSNLETIKLAKGNQQNSSNTLDTPRKT